MEVKSIGFYVKRYKTAVVLFHNYVEFFQKIFELAFFHSRSRVSQKARRLLSTTTQQKFWKNPKYRRTIFVSLPSKMCSQAPNHEDECVAPTHPPTQKLLGASFASAAAPGRHVATSEAAAAAATRRLPTTIYNLYADIDFRVRTEWREEGRVRECVFPKFMQTRLHVAVRL